MISYSFNFLQRLLNEKIKELRNVEAKERELLDGEFSAIFSQFIAINWNSLFSIVY